MSNAISFSVPSMAELWSRLWIPESSWNLNRSLDDAFLSDHGTAHGTDHLFKPPLPGIGPLEAYAGIPFLLLLGRPGSGKSHEMKEAAVKGWIGAPTVLVEAKEIGGADPASVLEPLLCRLPATGALPRLIIDGLDEVLLHNPSFVGNLKRWLRTHLSDSGRPLLNLAISCRWADWPVSQIDDLAALWSKQDYLKLILCPLKRSDAVATLQKRFGDRADGFWRQMHDLHLSPVACWPQGLIGLMNAFEDSGCQRLSASHAEAIRDQVLRHCKLTDNRDDLARWIHSVEGTEWRRRVAGRLAAAMLFSGKPQISLSSSSLSSHPECISPDELSATSEPWDNNRRTILLADLDDIIRRTGLARRLSDQSRWAFQSQVHQEWLAADWLAAQHLDEARLKLLFGTGAVDRWTVFPALKAVAAWLAGFDSGFRKLILQHDPLVLLRMDGASLPVEERAEIVNALLDASHEIQIVDPSIRHAHLPSLKHPGLAAQLTRWLTRNDVAVSAKELAIEIAEKTQLVELASLLWELYPSSAGNLQVEIAGALYRLAKEGFRDQWRAVLKDKLPHDPHGNILGAALDIMVISSREMPVREVLHCILPSRSFDFHGLYDIFASKVHERLTEADLPAVFSKLGLQPTAIHDSLSWAENLNASAVRLAVRNIDRPEIAEALGAYWHQCVRHHCRPHRDYNSGWNPSEHGLDDDDLRHRVVSLLLNHPDFGQNRDRKWVMPSDYVLLDQDLDWCLEQILAAKPEDEWRHALAVASLIWQTASGDRTAGLLNRAWAKSPALREMMPQPQSAESAASAIERIKSENRAKREHEELETKHRQVAREHKFHQELADYSKGCRTAHDRGELVWPGVWTMLGARQHGRQSRMVTFEPIAQIGPGDEWMVEAAIRYLVECPQKEPLKNHHGLLGLLALAACRDELDHESPVRQSVGKHWLPLFIGEITHCCLGKAPEGISIERFASLYPAAFPSAFGQVIRQRYLANESLGELQSFQEVWMPEMTRELARVLRSKKLNPHGFFHVMRYLAMRDCDLAVDIAREWLEKIGPDAPDENRASVVGTAAVILEGRLMSEVRPYMAEHAFFARSIRAVAGRLDGHDHKVDFSKWSDSAVKQLADACWQAFPRLERRRARGFRFTEITSEDHGMEFRDQVTAAARNRGLEVMIPSANPEDSEDEAAQRSRTINWHRHLAAQSTAANSWQPLQTPAFLQYASRSHARLARDNEELMTAVTECLGRWEADLDRGAWDHLWDIGTCSLRGEDRIAQEMRDWLDSNLEIMVEREVKLASADRPDIIVQTMPTDPGLQKLTVVIELKRLRASNARERRTAMKTQLLERYLKPRQNKGWTHGLYVVAWTAVPGSRDDCESAIQAARSTLAAQAGQLSSPPFVLKSLVIDARYRGQMAPSTTSRRKK